MEIMLTISSPDFNNNEVLPAKFTGEGQNISPALNWTGIPSNTASLAVIMDDPDAPTGLFTHWIIFNIPPECKKLPQAVKTNLLLEDGSMQGKNTAGTIGYYGPYPPPGPAHRYQFNLYALDKMIDVKPGTNRKEVLDAMQSHIIASAMITGIYQRTVKQ
jgi:Raf kinase inhibitor-like YbhB/YbcL family protein